MLHRIVNRGPVQTSKETNWVTRLERDFYALVKRVGGIFCNFQHKSHPEEFKEDKVKNYTPLKASEGEQVNPRVFDDLKALAKRLRESQGFSNEELDKFQRDIHNTVNRMGHDGFFDAYLVRSEKPEMI